MFEGDRRELPRTSPKSAAVRAPVGGIHVVGGSSDCGTTFGRVEIFEDCADIGDINFQPHVKGFQHEAWALCPRGHGSGPNEFR